MVAEKEEWEAMITEEVTSLEAQLAAAQGKAEELSALEGSFRLLQEEKAEADEYLAEFEQASIEENEDLQTKLKEAVAGKEAAEASATEVSADAEAAMEVSRPSSLDTLL